MTQAGYGGDRPHLSRGVQEDYKRFLYSEYDRALTVPITLQAGYGVLPLGSTVAKNLSAAGNAGMFVPYNPTVFTGAEDHPGRLYLLSNVTSGSGDNQVEVTLDDSYKVTVGDDVIVNGVGETVANVGAVTAIDRTTYTNKAVITFTSPTGTDFTTANSAYVAIEAGVSSNNYSDCVGLLLRAVDTGVGSDAGGGHGIILVSNAVFYDGMAVNFDVAAKVDISASTFGQYVVLK